jgi:TolB-like protein/Flp pilus assembly protein TadD
MNVRHFFAELKGRGVYRVSALYAAGSWALLQVADVLFPIIGLSDRAITTLLAAAAMGFPIALTLAWLFDISPGGITETDAVNIPAGSPLLSPARIAELSLLVMLVLLVGFLYLDRLDPFDRGWSAVERLWSDDERPALAVLPFVNLSEDASAEYLGDGIAAEILTLLSRISELDVAARSSSFYFKGRDTDVRDVGRNLGVSHVLEGSVRSAEGRVRVDAQLVDARTGFRLWSETFDRDFDDSFTIQDQVARQVVDKLKLILSQRSKQILEERPSLDPVAYDFYLRGRDYLRRSPSADKLASAIALFERAVQLDPDYADALAGLCDAHLARYQLGRDAADFNAAEQSCERALELSSSAPSVQVALGNLYQASGRLEDARGQFELALAADPRSADALLGLASNYQLDNRPADAEANYKRAIQLYPNYWRVATAMGGFLFNSGRFEEALPYYRRVTELVPDDAQAVNGLAAVHYLLGDFAAAADAFARSIAIEPTAEAYANSGSSLFFLGRYREALAMYHQAVELAPEDFQNWGALGDAYRHASGVENELADPMYDNAIRLVREHLNINPQDSTALSLLAHYAAQRGDRELALVSLTKAQTLAPRDMYVFYNSALALSALGEYADSVAALRTAIDLGYSAELVQRDAGFNSLRDNAAYQRLMGVLPGQTADRG